MSEVAAPPAPPPPDERPGRRGGTRYGSKLVGLGLSFLVLYAVVRQLDLERAVAVLATIDAPLTVLAVGLIAPLIYLSAVRFYWVVPRGSLPGVAESVRLALVAIALNLLLPAKLGDLAKSLFIVKRGGASPGVAVATIVMERLYDFFGLLTIGLSAWALGYVDAPMIPTAVFAFLASIWLVCTALLASERLAALLYRILERLVPADRFGRIGEILGGWPALLRATRGRRFGLGAFSIGLWTLHLTQLWLFTRCVHAEVPFIAGVGLASLVLLAGLMPFTLAGIGVREAAFVALFARYMSAEAALAAALLANSRVLLPPIVALPYLRRYGALALERRAERLRTDAGAADPDS